MDKCREEFEKHYLNLPFHDSKAAQKCLDSCDFDVKQNVYIPNAKWFDDNDADEGVIYCCMLNTAYMSFQHQQAKVEELQTQLSLQRQRVKAFEEELTSSRNYGDELQKRVDAVKGLIEDLNKCYQQDHQNKFEYWRGFSHSAGISAKRLEQALKGEDSE